MSRSDFTLLTKEQTVSGDKNLEILKETDVYSNAEVTDYSIAIGMHINETLSRNSSNKNYGVYWTQSQESNKSACSSCGVDMVKTARTVGTRICFPLDKLKEKVIIKKNKSGFPEIEYGYYPQTAVDKNLQDELTEQYISGNLIPTGNKYTKDSNNPDDFKKIFSPTSNLEYEYKGKRYVGLVVTPYRDVLGLSKEPKYLINYFAWFEVEPIKWLVDEKTGLMVTEKILFSGIQFDNENNISNNQPYDFEKTDIKNFIDNYFAKEIVQVKELSSLDIKENEEQESGLAKSQRRKNPYGFEFNKASEEDIIKGAVQGGVAVFLHGKSSDGKSARVKQLDPDCEIIYLRNATPESLNGKSVYNQSTGEMIDVKPTWLKKLENKCEKENDKIHILFFDEITNALPSIQGMAFNIVLDREVNGKWKLPENARIVAAGNDLEDSLAANTLAEPLFNRFAHVYINTTIESWLKWAATPEQEYERLDYNKNEETTIHPAICDFIEECDKKGIQVLRTKYTGEKPNADPRKWEMASNVLYATKQPKMLRALIGEELTNEFVTFCKRKEVIIEQDEEELEI